MFDLQKSWDKAAALYNRQYKISTEIIHYGPLCPGEDGLKLMGPIEGLRAIDLGCGGGQNAIALAKAGASVTAVDFSDSQLQQAENLAGRHNVDIDFVLSDVAEINPIPDSTFDIALSACAMAFVKRIGQAFAEAYRILKPGGRFFLSVMHPFQYIIDGEEGSMYFNSTYPHISRLLKWNWDFPGKSIDFRHYLRPVSEYHNLLVEAGFIVKKILEPKATLKTPHLGISQEIMREYPYIARHLPITLILVGEKPANKKRSAT
jgi:ubiquinone/menaquinone biosynthesis C-methylase UbiE